jgi:hypothetical protein
MRHRILTIVAALMLGLAGCAARELRCDGRLEPINAVPANQRADGVDYNHAR